LFKNGWLKSLPGLANSPHIRKRPHILSIVIEILRR
jgi:hypothetical protein